jgi:hypothetical protein
MGGAEMMMIFFSNVQIFFFSARLQSPHQELHDYNCWCGP